MLTKNMGSQKPLLEVSHLSKHFKINRKEVVKAVDDVSFSIKKGETLGLVGESGCGKTTCGRTAIGLYRKTSGQMLYYGREILELNAKERREYNRKVQMIFQDPYHSLDPKMKIETIIAEGLRVHKMVKSRQEAAEKVKELLEQTGLHADYAHRFPSEFSGGQRQRIGIARALAMEPEFILCDEPISALDVSVQVQIMNLLVKLQEERKLTYLFIAHNLAAVKYISDRIAVMYMGRIVEMGNTQDVYSHPAHPYTQALLSAVAIPDPDVERKRKKIILIDECENINSNHGCSFAPRCPYAKKECREEVPELSLVERNHQVACHLTGF